MNPSSRSQRDLSGDPLDDLQIASPCGVAWSSMRGAERVRYCEHCRLNVYNLSAMSRADAEALVRQTEGRLCVRFYRRRDGTMLTSNCPEGLRTARRWLVLHFAGLAALLGVAAIAAPVARVSRWMVESESFQRVRHSRLSEYQPFGAFFDWVDPQPAGLVMGEMAMPTAAGP